MPSPSKKRKLDTGASVTPSSRGLEYFFAKQRRASPVSSNSEATSAEGSSHLSTDEELARKLQAEFDQEASGSVRRPQDVQSRAPIGTELLAGNSETPENPDVQPRLQEDPLPRAVQVQPNLLKLQSIAAVGDSVSSEIPFDESPLTFDPAKYLPALRDFWRGQGGEASYGLLTRCFFLVNSTQSRIKIVDTLVNCLRILIEGDPSSLLPAVWLATNAISPPYISLELGIGPSILSKALKQVCGLDNRSLKALYDKYGDAGDVAYEAKKRQSYTLRKPQPLTIRGVYQSLVKIATVQGQGSTESKQRIVDRLLQDASGGEESRYIVRTLCQHLRIGAVKTTMLIALSRAFLLSRPPGADFIIRNASNLQRLKKDELSEIWGHAEELIKACFARRPNYNDIVPVLLEIGVTEELLLRCGISLHVPLRPMLGNITRDLSEMLTKLQGRDFACEFKYDGQRAQIHCDANGKVSIFSRHLELMTDKYPDLVALMPRVRSDGVESFILEGEVVAVDRSSGDLKNFQTLTTRARKDVELGSITIDVCLFAFDLMFLNGQPLLDRPLRERRELLRSLFNEVPNHFTWVRSMDSTSQESDSVLDFFKLALENKCEGIMVKILDNIPTIPSDGDEDAQAAVVTNEKDEFIAQKTGQGGPAPDGSEERPKSRRKPLLATYEPDKRLDSWLKVKKDYSTSYDTLDLVPVAGWHGQGRKAKWWSPILLAVRNDNSGALEVVCKCISGFTDAFYKANREFYDDGQHGEMKNTLTHQPAFVEYTGPVPDVWFEPQEVWEVGFADITLSPTYSAAIGLVSDERGLSLRFPRFLKKREDKGIEEASTSDFLAALYRKQDTRATEPAQVDYDA